MEKKIKQYFRDFKVSYDPAHWTLMQQRMEIEELSTFTENQDQALDSFVKNKLQDQSIPYNHAHWQKLEAQLIGSSRRDVFNAYKLVKAAIFLILLFSSTLFLNRGFENQQLLSFNNISIGEKMNSPSNYSRTLENIGRTASKRNIKKSDKVTKVLLLPGIMKGVKLDRTYLELSVNKPEILYSPKQSKRFLTIPNAYHESLAENFTTNQYRNQSIKYAAPNSIFRLGIFGSTALDQHSLESEDNIDEPNTYGFAVGGGVSFSWQMHQLEIETGAAYNSIKAIQTDKDLAENLALNKINNLEDANSEKYLRLPIAVKYLFKDIDSWKFYALGGGNVHINLNDQNDELLANQPVNPSLGAKVAFQSVSGSEASKIQDSFFNRLYYTANIGIGIEKQLSKRLSIFAQPEYFHQLFKPAIANDRGQTNTFAISFGMKTKL